MRYREPRIAVISRTSAGEKVAEILRSSGIDGVRCPSFESLFREYFVGSISVIVVDLNRDRRSSRLGSVGRIAFEHPHVQLIAIRRELPSPLVGAYLTSCSVDLIRGRLTRETAGEIASVVSLVYERQEWSLEPEPANREFAV